MKLFKIAVEILKNKAKIGNLRNEVYSKKLTTSQQKYLFKIVIESLKFSKDYLEILLEKIPKLRLPLEEMTVYLWEFLLGSRKILSREIQKNKTRIQAEFIKIKLKKPIQKDDSYKYLRINTLKTSKDLVLMHFRKKGFKFFKKGEQTLNQHSLSETRIITEDDDLEFLLKVNSRIDLSKDELYLQGKIIFQDKASCFSAKVLLEGKEGLYSPNNANNTGARTSFDVIDATAAPGNKTSHLAMIMKNQGRIFAFERDSKRFKILEKMLEKAGVENTIAKNMDFLKVNPEDLEYRNVQYILLDPSCSGSGIVSRMEFSFQDPNKGQESLDTQKNRLDSLSKFQKEIILHAFKFPNLQRVVYSTCSVHREENEDVVKYILENQTDFVLEENMFPEWKRRGLNLDNFDQGKHLIRTLPEEDNTIGFFVAVFRRKSKSKKQ